MLSGGDYTSGLENIGVVTALDLISEFALPLEQNADREKEAFALLQRISDWLNDRHKASDGAVAKKSSSADEKSPSKSQQGKRDNVGDNVETARRLKLRAAIERNNDKETIEAFPSRHIFDAYSQPVVDSSTEKPIWSTVNMKDLEAFVWQRLGWDSDRLQKQTQGSLQKWNEYMSRSVGGKGVAYQTHITSFTHKLQKSEDDQRLAPTARVTKALRRLAAARNEHPDPSVSLICKATLVDEPSDSSNLSTSFDKSQNLSQPSPPSVKSSQAIADNSSATIRRPTKKNIKQFQNEDVIKKKEEDESDPIANFESAKHLSEQTTTTQVQSINIKRRAPTKRVRGRPAKTSRTTTNKPSTKAKTELQLSEESSGEN